MSKRLLPLIPSSLVVDHVQHSATEIQIRCHYRAFGARCPCCSTLSKSVHSRYERRIADLPWQGRAVIILLEVRRLRCISKSCERRVFAQYESNVTAPYGRKTSRLYDVQRCVGMALGGEAGARLVERLGMHTSADTLLRLIRTERGVGIPTPRILGIDDWAWRRGQQYGTILVDLETNDIVDLLPDREMTTLANWLAGHPGVEIIARDRAGAYARGAREGAPTARQVADRWHLLRNCSDAVLNIVERRYRLVRDVGNSLASQLKAVNSARPVLTDGHQKQRKAKCDEVLRLNALGWSQLAIKRHLNVDLKTIRKWLKDRRPGTWQRKVHSSNPADVHDEYLRKRWREGCRNATQLYREVCQQGYDRNVKTFREWVKARLRDELPAPQLGLPEAAQPWRPPSSRQITRLLTMELSALPRNERSFVEALCSTSAEIATAAALARRFQTMIRMRDADALDTWLTDAAAGPLASLARGLKRDIDAVQAALTLPWSTGPVEGKINKLKLIKRSMYGRAGIDLLRMRLLAT